MIISKKVVKCIKNIKNSIENNTTIVTYKIDFKIEEIIIKHIYYLTTSQNITSSLVIYGNNIKSICALMYMKGSSLDAIKSLLGEFTDNKLIPSKDSIYNWIYKLSNVLSDTEYEKIKQELSKSLVLYVDETPIKIDREQYYIHNISNSEYTLQYVNKNRGEKVIKDFDFLTHFKGILVHDYFIMYYNYGINNAECKEVLCIIL